MQNQLHHAADSLEKNVSICIFTVPNPPTNKTIRAILSTCIFITISAIFKWKQDSTKSLAPALCENEAGTLSANQNVGLQCKIDTANQGVVELYMFSLWHLSMH